jgi:hypothetical protein
MKSIGGSIDGELDDGFLLRSLLTTVGYAVGPSLVDALPDNRPRSGAEEADRIDYAALASLPWLVDLLGDARIKSVVDGAFSGAEALLARADHVVSAAGGAWRRAETRIFKATLAPRATIGIVLLLRLSNEGGEVLIVPSSRGTSLGPSEVAGAGLVSTLAVPSGSVTVLNMGTVFSLSPGDWLQLAFVRSWVKPDLLFSSALSAGTVETAPDFVRQWLGANVGFPAAIEEFLKGEAAVALGHAVGQSGRGI